MRLNEEDINYIYRQVRKELIREGFWDDVKTNLSNMKDKVVNAFTGNNKSSVSNNASGSTSNQSQVISGKTQTVANLQTTTGGSIGNGVKYMPLDRHISKVRNRQIKYLAIHYTAGGTSKAGAGAKVRNVFMKRRASADFAVDDGGMYQFNPNPKVYGCWAVGDAASRNGARNQNTISIEMCSNLKPGTTDGEPNHSGWYFTEATLNNARTLARILCQLYNIPKTNICRHFDITGKNCPGVIGWNTGHMHTTSGKRLSTLNNEEQWKKFLASI